MCHVVTVSHRVFDAAVWRRLGLWCLPQSLVIRLRSHSAAARSVSSLYDRTPIAVPPYHLLMIWTPDILPGLLVALYFFITVRRSDQNITQNGLLSYFIFVLLCWNVATEVSTHHWKPAELLVSTKSPKIKLFHHNYFCGEFQIVHYCNFQHLLLNTCLCQCSVAGWLSVY